MTAHDSLSLRPLLPAPPAGGRYLIAYSGGLDSTVLLHWLTQAELTAPLSAVHVHHGLQADADAWAQHCEKVCAGWGVPIELLHVKPCTDAGQSPEAAAREARYAALRSVMCSGDVFLTAHHQDDQAETFLLQALRGAGPRGLASMPVSREFAPGMHVRPLLNVSRTELESYARCHALSWIEDPSNRETRFSRNFLRHELMPRIRQHWPQAAALLRRSASLSAEAAVILDSVAVEDLTRCAGSEAAALRIPALLALKTERRRNLLRVWIAQLGLPLPEFQCLERIDRELLQAMPDATPLLAWPGAELRRYREQLFAGVPLPEAPDDWKATWVPDEVLMLPAGCGSLLAEAAGGVALRKPVATEKVSVRFAGDGERISLPGRRHQHALKDLCQQAGIPPWVRRRLPLVLFDDRIAAVADQWVCAGFLAADTPFVSGYRLRWQDPPLGYPAPN